MRVLHTTLVDISCSISSVLTLLSLLLISFNTTGLINLFYVVFCLVFLYQMKSFIFQKRWTFPIYLEKLLKPFVFIEIWIQIFYQIPLAFLHANEDNSSSWQMIFGIFRLWQYNDGIHSTRHQVSLILKSIMLVFIMMQENIFTSIDYRGFLLKKLSKIRVFSTLKAFCLTYRYNNMKIKKIVEIQYEK